MAFEVYTQVQSRLLSPILQVDLLYAGVDILCL